MLENEKSVKIIKEKRSPGGGRLTEGNDDKTADVSMKRLHHA